MPSNTSSIGPDRVGAERKTRKEVLLDRKIDMKKVSKEQINTNRS